MEDSYIQRSPFPTLSYPSTDIYSLLQSYITRYSTRDALVDSASGATFTYKQLEDEVERVALGLTQHGVKQGDIVLCFAQNSLEYVFMTLAIWRLGAVFSAVNHLLTVNDARKLFSLAEPVYIFTDEGRVQTSLEICKHIPSVRVIFIRETHAGCVSYANLNKSIVGSQGAPKPRNIGTKDTCSILFSSGTTGLPKGVMLSHENLVFFYSAISEPNICIAEGHMTNFAPMAHISGVFVLIHGIMKGCTIIVMERFDLNRVLQHVSTYKVKSFPMLPPVAVLLTKHPVVSDYDLSHVQEMFCAAAPLGEDTIAQLQERLGTPIHFRQAWGLTEAAGFCTLGPGRNSTRKLSHHSVGFPIPGVAVKVVDIKTGKSLGPNQQGEIMCRGPNIMKGYLKNPKATAEAIEADGWLHTGDIGYYKPDSSFYIVDRLKELIKYKAYQVAPAELEDLLLSHPLVADCAVIGVPDVDAGELPLALVVRKEPKLTEKAIVDFVSDKVAPFKRLRGGVRFVEEIPKSPSGKILRTRIKAALISPKGKL